MTDYIKNEEIENTEENNYGYYSKLLSKPFDSLAELKEAEKAELDARAEKEQKSLARKTEAGKVEEAYKNYTAATRSSAAKIDEAKKECAKAIADAKSIYFDKVNAEQEVVDKAHQAYIDALHEFSNKYPEGFHGTFKDGDVTTTISYSRAYKDIFDGFFDSVMTLFK